MQTSFWKALSLSLALMALPACSSNPDPGTENKPPSANGGLFRQHNEGYSLLYRLMSDESDVGKIFILKQADDSVGNLVREVGTFCQDAKKQMDDFPKTDKRIEYDVTDLPYMDQRSRDLSAQDDQHALLTTSGAEFELDLLYTQIQAMEYAVHLSNALIEKEDDPGRKAFLMNVSKSCGDLHNRLMNMLAVKLPG